MAVIIIKFEQCVNMARVILPNVADRMANSEDYVQKEQSDQGLLCLPTPICPKTSH